MLKREELVVGVKVEDMDGTVLLVDEVFASEWDGIPTDIVSYTEVAVQQHGFYPIDHILENYKIIEESVNMKKTIITILTEENSKLDMDKFDEVALYVIFKLNGERVGDVITDMFGGSDDMSIGYVAEEITDALHEKGLAEQSFSYDVELEDNDNRAGLFINLMFGENKETKKEEEVIMKKNNYTVDIRGGEPIVIVNKSGKEYAADKGEGLTELLDWVKTLEVEVVDVTAKYQNSVDWFKANVCKSNTTGKYTIIDHSAEEIKEPAKEEETNTMTDALNYTGGIDYSTKKIDTSKLPQESLLFECGFKGIDPWSGREVTDRVIDYLKRNQNKLPKCFHGICIDYENQQRIRCGKELVTKKEVADKRRRGIFAAQKAQAEANKSASDNTGKPLF